MKLYRYIRGWTGGYGERGIELLELFPIKETSKTWHVEHNGVKHIIRKEKGRKRWAYDNKEDALRNFEKRTEKSLEICTGQVEDAKNFIEEIKKLKALPKLPDREPEYETF